MQVCILLIYFMEINMYSEHEKNLNLDVLAILRSRAEEKSGAGWVMVVVLG